VAYGSEMVRVYEPTLKAQGPSITTPVPVSGSALAKFDKSGEIMQFEWTEVSRWRCALVQWLNWDNFVGNSNSFVACASADSTYAIPGNT